MIVVAPAVQGGVLDYASLVVGRLDAGSRLVPVRPHEAGVLRQHMQGEVVCLHYSGYGYARRGAPLGLLRALEASRRTRRALIVYFHELYASGPPWSSACWLSPLQRLIFRRLAELADGWMTSCERYAGLMPRSATRKPHAIVPIPSNVGEMRAFQIRREPRVIVFGGSELRRSTYAAAGEAFFDWARAADVSIDDVGPPLGDAGLEARLRTAGVRLCGRLDADEAHRMLASARYGVLARSGSLLAKSSVFAAYCAHGVCPIVFDRGASHADGLRAGEQFAVELPRPGTETASVRIGEAAWEWYQAHTVDRHVAVLLEVSAAAARGSAA
jgi:hypothetical protein